MTAATFRKALVWGVTAMGLSLFCTWLASLCVPTTNLPWSLIAVGFASLGGSTGGYLLGSCCEKL